MNFPGIEVTGSAPQFGGFGWGDVFSAGAGLFGADRMNTSNAKQAARQMEFQERMSSTAHQREVKDLIAAGLNPILSASRGGASTPGGSQATMHNTVSSAVDAARHRQEMSNMKEQWHNINMDTSAKEAQQVLTNRQAELVEQQRRTEVHETNRALWDSHSARSDSIGKRVEEEIDKEGTGDWSRRIQRFLGVINSAAGAHRFRVR